MLAYKLLCECEDSAVLRDFVAWLRQEHLADVCAAGALDAEVVELDGAAPAVEVTYHFASRVAFSEYEANHAPRLRELGRARFSQERVQITRRTGRVLARHPT